MDIAVLNYPTGEVDILRNVFCEDVESFLENQGYNLHDIHYMCSEEMIINDNN